MNFDVLDEAINHLHSGSAICFVGAGFSLGALDSTENRQIPNTSQLTAELWSLAGVPEEPGSSLSDIAEYFQSHTQLRAPFRSLLLQRLTNCKPTHNQAAIAASPWRAIFSTNFDDILEQVHRSVPFQIVTPATNSRAINAAISPLYYLHGRARDLVETDVDPVLVISESNYLGLRSENADLYAAFLNELHSATRIFFIGYSLRDSEIAKRLFAVSDALRGKSIVISGPKEGAVALARLAKFGEVYPIGVDGFADRLQETKQPTLAQKALKFLHALPTPRAKTEVTKNDVDRLILTGEFDLAAYFAQRRGDDDSNLYCVHRTEAIDKIFNASTEVNRFLVTSDVGNGKSVILYQIAAEAAGRGYDTYWIDSGLREIYDDINVILTGGGQSVFIIDDLVRYRAIASHIGARMPATALLVCGTREVYDDPQFTATTALLGGAVREIDVNALNMAETRQWDRLLERWGYWEGRIEWDQASRIEFLQRDCSSENRSLVVSLFRTSYLSKKIEDIVSYFLTKRPNFKRAFLAMLIASLCQKHVRWERVVDWLNIDEEALKRALSSEQIFDFTLGRRDWYQFTSTQLADYIFKNFDFDPEAVVDTYTEIVRQTAYSANDFRSGYDAKENLKELMKFRFLSRIFGEGGVAAKSIEAVYSRLSKVPRIRDNDQFWLQYAMSCMERHNLSDAETYLKTALGIARKRGVDYSPHQILDQRVRLLFMKNAQRSYKLDEQEIATAVGDLGASIRQKDISAIYPLRSATFILELLDEKIDDLSASARTALLTVLDELKEAAGGAGDLPKSQKGETKKLREDLRKARLVLQNA